MDVFVMFNSLRETALEWAEAGYESSLREVDYDCWKYGDYAPYYEVNDFGSTDWYTEDYHFLCALMHMQIEALRTQRRMQYLEPLLVGC